MQDIYQSLAPHGRVIVALVVPYCHYVETSNIRVLLFLIIQYWSWIKIDPVFFAAISDESHLPIKPLLPHWPNKCNLPFEYEVNSFFEELEIMGFNIESWTRAPYLCQGDLRQSFYWLVDVVAVLSKKNLN